MGAGILLAVYEPEGQRALRLVMGTGFGTESSRFDAAEEFLYGEKEPSIDAMYENMPRPPENVSGALKFNVILLSLRLHMISPRPVWYARDTRILQCTHLMVLIFFTNQLFAVFRVIINRSNHLTKGAGAWKVIAAKLLSWRRNLRRAGRYCWRLVTKTAKHLILEMMQMEHCGGARVGAITERTHLSRPAVSHHIRILKDAGILKMRREGTKNYYYFDADAEAMNRLLRMLEHAKAIMERLPDRSGET